MLSVFAGRNIPTSSREIIEVKLNEVDAGQEQVLLVELRSSKGRLRMPHSTLENHTNGRVLLS